MPQSDVPGKKSATTQQCRASHRAYARNFLKMPDDVIDFTPEMRAQGTGEPEAVQSRRDLYSAGCRQRQWSSWEPSASVRRPEARTGRAPATNPETHVFYSQAGNSSLNAYSVAPPPPGFSDIRYVQGVAGREFRESLGPGFGMAADSPVGASRRKPRAGRARGAAARRRRPGDTGARQRMFGGGGLTVQGLPIVKPPYGVLSAINLDRGELMWSVPHGDTPDDGRQSPGAQRTEHSPRPACRGASAILVTKTLVVAGDPWLQHVPGTGPRGAMLRAYKKSIGSSRSGTVFLPAPQSGSPMTYSVGGKR